MLHSRLFYTLGHMPNEHNVLFQADSNQSSPLQVVICDLCYLRRWVQHDVTPRQAQNNLQRG